MDSFNIRKAEEYVDRFGEDLAVKRLDLIAYKNPQAKKMLDYILGRNKRNIHLPKRKSLVNQRSNIDSNRHIEIRNGKVVLGPKERFLNMMNTLDLSFDLPTDGEFHPVVDVEWTDGKACINGFNVNFPSEDADFMFGQVKSRKHVVLRMVILGINSGGVIAKPDVDEYYRRKHNQFRSGVQKFCGTVIRRYNYVHIDCNDKSLQMSYLEKRIVVPRRFLSDLLLKPGQWMFKVLDERKDFVLAEPVEKVDERILEVTQKQMEYEEQKKIAELPLEKLAEQRLEELNSSGSVKL